MQASRGSSDLFFGIERACLRPPHAQNGLGTSLGNCFDDPLQGPGEGLRRPDLRRNQPSRFAPDPGVQTCPGPTPRPVQGRVLAGTSRRIQRWPRGRSRRPRKDEKLPKVSTAEPRCCRRGGAGQMVVAPRAARSSKDLIVRGLCLVGRVLRGSGPGPGDGGSPHGGGGCQPDRPRIYRD